MYRENLIIVVLKCIYASWKGWETLVQSIYSKSSRELKLFIIIEESKLLVGDIQLKTVYEIDVNAKNWFGMRIDRYQCV